jgi:DNA-directed RNA polymerase alpha subunit
MKLPLGVNVAAWCTSEWRTKQEEGIRVALQALSGAERDGILMPVRRCQEYVTAARVQQGNATTEYAILL